MGKHSDFVAYAAHTSSQNHRYRPRGHANNQDLSLSYYYSYEDESSATSQYSSVGSLRSVRSNKDKSKEQKQSKVGGKRSMRTVMEVDGLHATRGDMVDLCRTDSMRVGMQRWPRSRTVSYRLDPCSA